MAKEPLGRANGSIAITFHQKRVNHSKPAHYYAVKQGGYVRWQNYPDSDLAQGGGSKKVYELKDGYLLQTPSSNGTEIQNAMAPTPTPTSVH